MALAGKVAIVTGGAGGIGAETCRRLAADGAKVLCTDLQATEAVVQQIISSGGQANGLDANVSQRKELELIVSTAVDLWGRLDIVVNNAMWMGVGGPSGGIQGTAVELDEESWDYAMDVGLKAVFLMTKLAVPEMAKNGSGSIVNVSSVEGALMSRRNAACALTMCLIPATSHLTLPDSVYAMCRCNSKTRGYGADRADGCGLWASRNSHQRGLSRSHRARAK